VAGQAIESDSDRAGSGFKTYNNPNFVVANMNADVTTAMLPVAGLFGLLGYLIREREMLHLIAGYDPSTVTDEEGLADFFGTYMYVLALLTLGNVVADLTFGYDALRWTVYWIVFVALFLRIVMGSRAYEDR